MTAGPGRLTAGELIMAVPAIDTPQNPVIRWLDERLGIMEQDYPVPAHSMSLLHSLGTLTLAAFVLLSITGLYLLQFTSSAFWRKLNVCFRRVAVARMSSAKLEY